MMIVSASAAGQAVIDNPAKPAAKNAGRTVALKETGRIRDDGEKILFQAPQRLALAPDGTLFFMDGPRLYAFTGDGKLVAQFLKAGEGPGECQYPDAFFFEQGRVRVEAWVPPKVLDFDFNGKLLKETKSRVPGPFWYLARTDGRIFGVRDEIRHSEAIFREGFIEAPYAVYEIAPDFQNCRRIYDIPVLHYIAKSRWWRRGMITFVAHENFLFIVHTAEYKVAKLDLRTGRVERVFKRPYPRRKAGPEEAAGEKIKDLQGTFSPPPEEYLFDILGLHVVEGALWVVTSTAREGESQRLIDVFDFDGRFADSFYLGFPDPKKRPSLGWGAISAGGRLFVPDEDEDGFWSIGIYEIPKR